MENKSKTTVTAVIAILAIAAGIGFWYRQSKKMAPAGSASTETFTQEKVAGGLGGNIYEKSQNPISDKLPETNPFGASINPFEKEANPLKAQYKNPFE